MKNSALKFVIEVTRDDGSLAQQLVFDQRGLTHEQLLELQAKAVVPCAEAVMEVVAAWAVAAAGKNAS